MLTILKTLNTTFCILPQAGAGKVPTGMFQSTCYLNTYLKLRFPKVVLLIVPYPQTNFTRRWLRASSQAKQTLSSKHTLASHLHIQSVRKPLHILPSFEIQPRSPAPWLALVEATIISFLRHCHILIAGPPALHHPHPIPSKEPSGPTVTLQHKVSQWFLYH